MQRFWMGMSLWVAACSSTRSNGVATISGTLHGAQPVARDAIAFNKNGNLVMKLTDYTGACALEEMNNTHKQDSHYLELYLGPYPGHVGVYDVGSGSDAAGAEYFTRDATCSGSSDAATVGSISIDDITADHVRGSFDLSTWEPGTHHERVTGTFTAVVCGDGTPVSSGGGCVP